MLLPTLSKSKRCSALAGFTLIEVMVAIVILMVGLLGMFQSINLVMEKDIESQLLQRGVEVAEQRMSDLKAMPFANLTGNNKTTATVAIGSSFRNMSVESLIQNLATTKQVSVRVSWRYRGRSYEHQTASGIGSLSVSGN